MDFERGRFPGAETEKEIVNPKAGEIPDKKAPGLMSRFRNEITGLATVASLAGCAEIKPVADRPEQDVVVKIEPAPKAIIPKPEQRELPPGADGRDADGHPFGWGMIDTYRYFSKEPIFEDLEPYMGRDSRGNEIAAELREEPFEAYLELEKEAKETFPDDPNLREAVFETTESCRSFKDQKRLRNKYEKNKKNVPFAARPGFGEHQLCTTIDIRNAKYWAMYDWLMEYEETKKDKTYLPRIIRQGFIPTVPTEPWHFRYVGKELAEVYFQRHRAEIFDPKKGHLQFPFLKGSIPPLPRAEAKTAK